LPRLFTGLEVPPVVAAQLALLRGRIPRAHWIDAENYHVTLRFIGDIDTRTASDVAEILSEITRPRFPLAVEGLGWFGADKPRAIIAKITPTAPLVELQAEHERRLRRIGLPAETRKFIPHVTLARLRSPSPVAVADYLGMHGYVSGAAFEATRFVLFSARESTGGGPYVAEAVYDLQGTVRS
jgi:RNA 2',3'-cyclic 3'-phosphodiesterase